MKESISKKQLREFGFLIGFGFPIIIGWILPGIGGHPFRLWPLLVGVPSLIIGIIKPYLLYGQRQRETQLTFTRLKLMSQKEKVKNGISTQT